MQHVHSKQKYMSDALMLFILLTGHNEDLPCQIVYNQHSFLLQSKILQRKKYTISYITIFFNQYVSTQIQSGLKLYGSMFNFLYIV